MIGLLEGGDEIKLGAGKRLYGGDSGAWADLAASSPTMSRDLTNSPLIFYGALVTTQSPFLIKYLPRALMFIQNGIIQWIEEDVGHDAPLEAVLKTRRLEGSKVIKLRRGEFLVPGFVDTHTVRETLSPAWVVTKLTRLLSETVPTISHNSTPLSFPT